MWDQLWSKAKIHLRLSTAEFMELQPREFDLLIDAHNEATKRDELLTGIIASTIANFAYNHPKEPLPPSAFMPSLAAKQPHKRVRMTRKRREHVATNIRAMFNARIKLQDR